MAVCEQRDGDGPKRPTSGERKRNGLFSLVPLHLIYLGVFALLVAFYLDLDSVHIDRSYLLASLALLVAGSLYLWSHARPQVQKVDRERKLLEEKQHRLSNEIDAEKAKMEIYRSKMNESQALYQVSSLRNEEIFRNLPIACYSFDREGLIFEWNAAAEELFGLKAHEVFLRPVWDVFFCPKEDLPRQIAEVEEVFSGKLIQDQPQEHSTLDGRNLHLRTSTFPFRSSQGEVIGAISANVDVTQQTIDQAKIKEQLKQINANHAALESQKRELEDMNRKLSTLALTDGLTGLRNHRSFQESLDRLMERVRQTNQSLSLVLLDVDKFKQFNDTYGHPQGDLVLQTVGELLSMHTHPPALAARYGGEEFVVILPGIGEHKAMLFAEMVRRAIQESCPTGRRVTASFGVSTWHDQMYGRAELLNLADRALYASKERGRNRVTHSSILEEPNPGRNVHVA